MTSTRPAGVGPVLGWSDEHPTAVILLGIGAGFALGSLVPAAGGLADALVLTTVAVAIALTLMPVPFVSFGRAVLDRRFLAALLLTTIVVAPLLTLVLSRVVFRDPDLQLGLLLVLLAPGVGLVAGLVRRAGGAVESLLATAPLMLIVHAITLPGLLILFTLADGFLSLDGSGLPAAVLLGIVAPAAAVAGAQLLGLAVPGVQVGLRRAGALAVPATALAAGLVAAVYVPRAAERLDLLVAVAPLFGVHLIVMTPLGILVGTAFALRVGQVRALTFAGAARNGLLVLPIAMAFEEGFELVPLVVVLFIAVEAVGMLVYRYLVPSITQQSRGAYSQD